MSITSLERVFLGERAIGYLVRYDDTVTLQFDPAYVADPQRPVLSVRFRDPSSDDITRQLLVGRAGNDRFGTLSALPVFFANCLPEGLLKKHLTALPPAIAPDDAFALLGRLGLDLPGAVRLVPENEPSRTLLAQVLTQNNDNVELSVLPQPLDQGFSLSGVQPKWTLVEQAGHYVKPGKDAAGRHVIAKFSAADMPHLVENEYSCLALARAVLPEGQVAEASLQPLSALGAEVPFDLAGKHFLAVERFDRNGPTRIHMEDFAQALGVMPEYKYAGSLAQIAVTLALIGRRQDVLDLFARVLLNELMGNLDAHLKNFALLYRDPANPALAPAYDLVSHVAYGDARGRGGLRLISPVGTEPFPELTRAAIRAFCRYVNSALGEDRGAQHLMEVPLWKHISTTAQKAADIWPALLPTLPMTAAHRARLLAHLRRHPLLARRAN
jgi:serine/threonine-protein kinase HipA